jgi:hypothetical protein
MAQSNEDPVLKSSRREAAFVLTVFTAALVYTTTYCGLFAYGRSPESLKFVFGFPDWVFWGIVVPWGACVLVSCWFAYFFMTDEDLGEEIEVLPGEHEEASASGEGAR